MGLSLKPCPFCGKEPTLRETVEHYSADEKHPAGSFSNCFTVTCDHCGAEQRDEYRDDAVTAWNTRSEATEAQARRIKALSDEMYLDGAAQRAATPFSEPEAAVYRAMGTIYDICAKRVRALLPHDTREPSDEHS